MKTLAFLLIFLTGFAVTTQAQGGKAQQDVTYSIHNYKHPNKAAAASRWNAQPGTAIVTPNVQGALANYKRPVPGIEPGVSLSVPGNGPASVASRNYKASPLMLRSAQPAESLSKAKPKTNASSTTGE